MKNFNFKKGLIFPLLVISIIAGVLLVQQQTETRSKASGSSEVIDTLSYFMSDHPDKALRTASGEKLSYTTNGNTIYLNKFSPTSYVAYRWDDNNIYLSEDHSEDHTDNFQSYTFSPGTWLKRSMKVGETIDVSANKIQFFDKSCSPLQQTQNKANTGSFPYKMILVSHNPTFNAGGDLGIQDVIVVEYNYGTYEREFYSKEWGLIRWECRTPDGKYCQSQGQDLYRDFNLFTQDSPYKPDTHNSCLSASRAVDFAAQCIAENIPSMMSPGESKTVSLTLKNTGTSVWTSDVSNPIRLGLLVPHDSAIWNKARASLTKNVNPGESYTFSFPIKAPTLAGEYHNQWSMIKEGEKWFGELCGKESVLVALPKFLANYQVNLKKSWKKSETKVLNIAVKNTGNFDWVNTGVNVVHVGVHFGKNNDAPWDTDQRFTLPQTLKPGETVTISVPVTAPNRSGSTVLQVRMVQEGVTWSGSIYKENVSVQ